MFYWQLVTRVRCGGLVVALSGVVGKAEVRDGSGRNYSAQLRGKSIGIRGSYESVSRRDTRNNYCSTRRAVDVALSSSEMTPFA